VGNFGEDILFTSSNIEESFSRVVLLLVALILMVTFGLFTLVPAILMQYTMVMHLAQLHDKKNIIAAVEAATPKTLTAKEQKELAEKKAEAEARGKWWDLTRCSMDRVDEIMNSRTAVQCFLLLLIIDFSIAVLALVVRDDKSSYALDYRTTFNMSNMTDPMHTGFLETVADMEDFAHRLDLCCLVIAFVFVAEVLVLFMISPSSFLASPWDVFDAVLMIGYAIVLPILQGDVPSEDAFGNVLVLRIMRLLRFHRFVMAMTSTGSDSESNHQHRKELLLDFCKSHFLCFFIKREDDSLPTEEFTMMPVNRGSVTGEDPIAAMKAKRTQQNNEPDAALNGSRPVTAGGVRAAPSVALALDQCSA